MTTELQTSGGIDRELIYSKFIKVFLLRKNSAGKSVLFFLENDLVYLLKNTKYSQKELTN